MRVDEVTLVVLRFIETNRSVIVARNVTVFSELGNCSEHSSRRSRRLPPRHVKSLLLVAPSAFRDEASLEERIDCASLDY